MAYSSLSSKGQGSGDDPSGSAVNLGEAPQSSGDLGLATAITSPPCDGQYAVFVGAAVEPAVYQSRVAELLEAFPGSNYLLTEQSCSSLASSSNGNSIYALYYGPFADLQDACEQRSEVGSDSYIRLLDNTTIPGQDVEC